MKLVVCYTLVQYKSPVRPGQGEADLRAPARQGVRCRAARPAARHARPATVCEHPRDRRHARERQTTVAGASRV